VLLEHARDRRLPLRRGHVPDVERRRELRLLAQLAWSAEGVIEDPLRRPPSIRVHVVTFTETYFKYAERLWRETVERCFPGRRSVSGAAAEATGASTRVALTT
jgi:hypothetical protein